MPIRLFFIGLVVALAIAIVVPVGMSLAAPKKHTAPVAQPPAKTAPPPAETKPEKVVWDRRYDDLFRKYSKRYFGANFDWRWFKAQAAAESRLKHHARSHVGAVGIMQIMPSTYRAIRKKVPGLGQIHDPRWNIAAGIFYNRWIYTQWNEVSTPSTRLDLTFASYNAGLSRIQRAVKRADDEAWPAVAPHAPKETRNYVERIHHIRREDMPRNDRRW